MYKNFLIIKNNFNSYDVSDFLKSLFSLSIKIEEKDDYLIIYHNLDDAQLIKNSISTLGDDLLVSIFAYISNPIYNLDVELDIAFNILKNAKAGVYDFKSLLLNNEINNKNKILNFIISGMGIDEKFIKTYVECNLNATKASKALYIHRNTLNYKLDRLKNERNFDLKNFIDAYILYSLIDNKL